MKLVFPDMNANYYELTHDQVPEYEHLMQLRSTSIFIENNQRYNYSIDCFFYTYEDYF